MKRVSVVFLVLAALSMGCGKTKTVNVVTDFKIDVGRQMSCIYSSGNLYCYSKLLTPEETKKWVAHGGMVTAIQTLEKERSDNVTTGESGAYSSKFSKSPVDYSLWNCSKTGNVDPAIRCELQIAPDPTVVAKTLDAVKFEESVLLPITQESLISACGKPRKTQESDISKWFYYPSTHSGTLIRLEFDTYIKRPSGRLAYLDSVNEKTDEFVQGPLWNLDTGADESLKSKLNEYLPCLK